MAEIVKQDQVHGNTAEAADVLSGSRHSELAGLLLHIREISLSLTEQQRLQAVARIADHSASDGMALGKDLKLNSAQIREIFLDDALKSHLRGTDSPIDNRDRQGLFRFLKRS